MGIALGDREQEAIREAFAGLERSVDVTLELGPTASPVTLLAAGGREIDSNAVAREVVESVCALSDRVSLDITEHTDAGPWPRTTIAPRLEYLGMPLGYELTTLVHAIVEAGRGVSSLSASTLTRLASLDRDVALDVFVTPT